VVERIVRREIYRRGTPGRIMDERVWNPAQRALLDRTDASGDDRGGEKILKETGKP
jgi:hypothetical protein